MLTVTARSSPSSAGWARRTRTRRWPTTPTRSGRSSSWSARRDTVSPAGWPPAARCSGCCPTATCPVAVAPRGHRHFATARMTAVSVAYDGSPEAERAAAVAARLAHRSGAALRFVAVAETPEQRPAAQTAALRGLACAPVELDALADVVDGPIVSTLAEPARAHRPPGDRRARLPLHAPDPAGRSDRRAGPRGALPGGGRTGLTAPGAGRSTAAAAPPPPARAPWRRRPGSGRRRGSPASATRARRGGAGS